MQGWYEEYTSQKGKRGRGGEDQRLDGERAWRGRHSRAWREHEPEVMLSWSDASMDYVACNRRLGLCFRLTVKPAHSGDRYFSFFQVAIRPFYSAEGAVLPPPSIRGWKNPPGYHQTTLFTLGVSARWSWSIDTPWRQQDWREKWRPVR